MKDIQRKKDKRGTYTGVNVDAKRIKAFTMAGNHSRILGLRARHGVPAKEPVLKEPREILTIAEAMQDVMELARAVVPEGILTRVCYEMPKGFKDEDGEEF